MKVAIMEVSSINHICMLETWVKICRCNGWSVTVFTKEEYVVQIDEEVKNYSELKLVTTKSVFSLVREVNRQSAEFDLLVLTTVQGHLLETLFLRTKCRTLVTIHNAKTWFTWQSLYRHPKIIIKNIIRYIWKGRADGFIVNSSNMKEYVEKLHVSKKVLHVPFSINRHEFKRGKNHNFKITFPGMVSNKRKKYDNFLYLAERFPLIDFVLLGRLNNEEGGAGIEERIKSKKLNNFKYYKNYVEAEEFEKVMCETDLLFSDININYQNSGIKEVYGVTKDSGVSYLMLEYALPVIVNHDFQNINELKPLTMTFESKEQLVSLVEELVKDPVINGNYRDKIIELRKELNVEYYAAQVTDFLNSGDEC